MHSTVHCHNIMGSWRFTTGRYGAQNLPHPPDCAHQRQKKVDIWYMKIKDVENERVAARVISQLSLETEDLIVKG